MAKNKDTSKIVQNGREWRREPSEPLLSVPEDEREHPVHYLPRLSVVAPASNSSSTDILASIPQKKPLSHGEKSLDLEEFMIEEDLWRIYIAKHINLSNKSMMMFESMTVVLSAFYAKLLIVLGIALPVTSTIQNELYTNVITDIFTIYLYTVGMAFLAYTFYHLRLARREKGEIARRTRYGSFYLHMGVAGFGVGSIIYSCLQFGGYFDLTGDCQVALVAIKPAFRIVFMVAQTVFIFSYTDILDPMRGVVIDRFGLMHLIATNVCEWLNVVVQETRDDILNVAHDRPTLLRYANISWHTNIDVADRLSSIFHESKLNESHLNMTVNSIHEKAQVNMTNDLYNMTLNSVNESAATQIWTCNVSDMITPLIRSVNPYLRPCGVEYSLLCSIIIAVIWNDICTVSGSTPVPMLQINKEPSKQCCARVKSNNHFSVDCGSAHKGLFMGIAVLAGTIVSLMLFNGLFHNEKYVDLALLQINIWETILFVIMTLGSGACIQRMRTLPLRRAVTTMPLEHSLLLVTQCGVYLYYLFQIIGAGFLIQRYPEGMRATRIISPLCALIQSSCQTLLVFDAWTRRCTGSGRQRPGRQLVTFLLVGNFALWLLNRVKNSRAEFHPLQMEFYGVWAWTLITHVSVPLLVCYRFQATVCFYEIWKNSYKRNKNVSDVVLGEFELRNNHTA